MGASFILGTCPSSVCDRRFHAAVEAEGLLSLRASIRITFGCPGKFRLLL